MSSESFRVSLAAFGVLCIGIAASLALRPLLPVDETRYVTVAWEMWSRGDLLVPHLNGAPYEHKPPVLFWSINLAWSLFCVGPWSARLVPPLYALAVVALTALLARQLWPGRSALPARASLVLASSALFALMCTMVMFDTALTAAVLVGLLGLARAWRRGGVIGWALFGAGIGLGLLTKGPVVLVHLLPVAFLAPVWQGRADRQHWTRWYAGTLGGLLLGAAIGLAWAIPAAQAGGAEYARGILWGQTSGRIVAAFDHARPWWFYLPIAPAALFPWICLAPVWRGLGRLRREADPGTRMPLVWGASTFILLSAISGKQPHYLLPLLPAAALLIARALDDAALSRRGWSVLLPAALSALLGLGITACGLGLGPALPEVAGRLDPAAGSWLMIVAALLAGTIGARPRLLLPTAALTPALLLAGHMALIREFARYDLQPLADVVSAAAPASLAVLGTYHGELGFLARLTTPVAEIHSAAELSAWAAAHPDGLIVARHPRDRLPIAAQPVYSAPFRSQSIGVWPVTPDIACRFADASDAVRLPELELTAGSRRPR